jgi:hypothetical protein
MDAIGRAVPAKLLLLACAALGLIVSLAPMPARAWDAGGHELVATMAGAQLNPKARQAVDHFAEVMSTPGHPYDAITLACWMDDLRRDTDMPDHGMFLGWHYIDIGVEPGDPAPSFEPGNDDMVHGNVVQALKRAVVVLKGGTDPYIATPAMACAIVMHLVGDIHQPLHCATHYFYFDGRLRQDAGGNKEEVENGPPDDRRFNLHAFWDSAWRASFDPATGRVVIDPRYQEYGPHDPQDVQALAEELSRQAPPAGVSLQPNIDGWALESNAIARDFVYRDLTATASKKFCRLGSGYVAKANLLARQRLVLAAARLAVLLNETLGADTPEKPPASYPARPPGLP